MGKYIVETLTHFGAGNIIQNPTRSRSIFFFNFTSNPTRFLKKLKKPCPNGQARDGAEPIANPSLAFPLCEFLDISISRYNLVCTFSLDQVRQIKLPEKKTLQKKKNYKRFFSLWCLLKLQTKYLSHSDPIPLDKQLDWKTACSHTTTILLLNVSF